MVLKGTVGVMEELEESQMRLQQMLTQRHVAPFRAEAQVRLACLSMCVFDFHSSSSSSHALSFPNIHLKPTNTHTHAHRSG